MRIDREDSCLWSSSAVVMAANSALLMVCLFGCDFISIWVMVWVLGLTMDAPRVGLPVTSEPSVYMYSLGFQAAQYGRMWRGCFGVVFIGIDG